MEHEPTATMDIDTQDSVLEVPLNDEPDQSIEIDLSEEDSETVNLILKNEKASLQIWLKVAVRPAAAPRCCCVCSRMRLPRVLHAGAGERSQRRALRCPWPKCATVR